MKHLYWLISGCLLAQVAQAQAPLIIAVSPGRHGETANQAANVVFTFSQPLSANPPSSSLRVFSTQRGGRLAGTLTTSGNTLTFDPARDFRVGEEVSVTATTALQGTNGTSLTGPQVYRFRVRPLAGPGTFGPRTDVTVGTSPVSLVTADVDGDGDLDFLVANQGSNTVSLRLNNGRGIFSGGTDIAVGLMPTGVVAADVDGDGDLDMLCTNWGSATVSVRLNNGAGSFGGGSEVAVSPLPSCLTTADVDGDGDLDLIAASNEAQGFVNIRLNNGSGLFSAGTDVGPALVLTAVASADVDNDGDMDLLTTSGALGPGRIAVTTVLLNNGLGTFMASGYRGVSGLPTGLAMGDIDGDGDVDFVTASATVGTVSVRLNEGAGLFSGSSAELATTTGFPQSVVLADIDGDSDLDLLTAASGSGALVFLNNGAGVFGPATSYYADGPRSIAAADVDGDGDLDILTANTPIGEVGVFLNTGTGSPLAARVPQAAARLEAWPNPAAEEVQLTGLGPHEEAQLLNVLGQLIAHITADGQGAARLRLPTALPAGTYVIKSLHKSSVLVLE